MADRLLRSTGRLVGRVLGSRVWVLWAVSATLAATVPGAALAQDGSDSGVRVSFTADRAALTVGDLVTLTLEVTHPADHVVVVPRLGPEWGPFEIISQTTAHTNYNGDGTETTSQQLTVAVFALGTFETPDLSISVRGPEGGVERVFPLPVLLTVNSVLSGPDERLKDIRAPADLASPLWMRPAALAVAVLATLAVLVPGAYVVSRRLRGRKPQPKLPVDARTPWEIAVQEIDRVERLDLPGDGRFKEHYALVAEVIQAYVRAMYLGNGGRPHATDMTTDEIGTAIWQSSLDRKNARLVVDLLLEADLVRFSRYTPLEEQAYETLRRARDILESTRPLADDATQPEATA